MSENNSANSENLAAEEFNRKHSWLVWSNEHNAWWRPNHRGYTEVLEEAGLYTEGEARNICAHADLGRRGEKPQETMIPYGAIRKF